MNKTPLLQPQRSEDETRSQYVERRESAHSYVEAVLGGTVFWNPSVQGTYTRDDKMRLNKTERRIYRKHLRDGRAVVAAAATNHATIA